MSIEIKLFTYLKASVPLCRNSGVVSTNGTAVTRVSGDNFNASWVGQPITINNVQYVVAAVTNANSLTLFSSAGIQASVTYGYYRIYALVAPQGVTKPYLVYSKVSPGRDYTHDGHSGLSRPRMQVSCYGTTYGSAKAVAVEVIAAMDAWFSGGVTFAPIAGEQDLYEPDTGLYHVPVDFFIHYAE